MIEAAGEANERFRNRTDMMINSGEALRGFPDRLELTKDITAEEGDFILGTGWSPAEVLDSETLRQVDVLAQEVLASDAGCTVLCVWDGVNLRQSLLARELFGQGGGSPLHDTQISPVVVHPPAMTAWGHFRLLHGASTWEGMTSVIGRPMPHPRHAAMLSWAVGGGHLEPKDAYTNEDVGQARQSIIQHQAKTFSRWRDGARAHFAYTGVRSVPPIQDNVIQPMLQAAEEAGLRVTQTGETREMGQLGRVRQALLDAKEEGADRLLLVCRFSLDSKGKSAAMGSDDHSALSASGHYAGPFHRHAIQHIAEVWGDICRVIEEYSPFAVTDLIATSDHGMTPLANRANDPFKKKLVTMDTALPESAARKTPWFSGRGMVCRTDNLGTLEQAVKAVNGGEGWFPHVLACDDPDWTYVSLDHGWGIDALKGDDFGASAHLGDHGGLGFDDIIVPLMKKRFESD